MTASLEQLRRQAEELRIQQGDLGVMAQSHRQNISNTLSGKTCTDEHSQNISNTLSAGIESRSRTRRRDTRDVRRAQYNALNLEEMDTKHIHFGRTTHWNVKLSGAYFGKQLVIGTYKSLGEAQAARDYVFEVMNNLRQDRNLSGHFDQNDTNIRDIFNEAIVEAKQMWNATSQGVLFLETETNIL